MKTIAKIVTHTRDIKKTLLQIDTDWEWVRVKERYQPSPLMVNNDSPSCTLFCLDSISVCM